MTAHGHRTPHPSRNRRNPFPFPFWWQLTLRVGDRVGTYEPVLLRQVGLQLTPSHSRRRVVPSPRFHPRIVTMDCGGDEGEKGRQDGDQLLPHGNIVSGCLLSKTLVCRTQGWNVSILTKVQQALRIAYFNFRRGDAAAVFQGYESPRDAPHQVSE